MRCRQRTVGRQHVVAVMSTASFAVVCVCVYDNRTFIKYAPHFGTWSPSSVVLPRHGPTAHIGSIRIRGTATRIEHGVGALGAALAVTLCAFHSRRGRSRLAAVRRGRAVATRAGTREITEWNIGIMVYALGFSERPLA